MDYNDDLEANETKTLIKYKEKTQDIVISSTPVPHPEPQVSNVTPGNAVFDHCIDDDVGRNDTFKNLMQFLHKKYFPRLAWVKLTINPLKCSFFVSKLLQYPQVVQGTEEAQFTAPSPVFVNNEKQYEIERRARKR